MIRTKPSLYCPKGKEIEEIVDIIPKDNQVNGKQGVGFLVCINEDGYTSYIRPEDLIPEEEVEKAIERLRNEE